MVFLKPLAMLELETGRLAPPLDHLLPLRRSCPPWAPPGWGAGAGTCPEHAVGQGLCTGSFPKPHPGSALHTGHVAGPEREASRGVPGHC